MYFMFTVLRMIVDLIKGEARVKNANSRQHVAVS
jgi:hypothetical protein